ncbi:MAG TPA: hypothetical protein VJS15_06690 [Allosphingosinicella sp.]|nr:hypothetical protein [Allosphingosinicella sp.]
MLMLAGVAAGAGRAPEYVKGEQAFKARKYRDAHTILRPYYGSGGRFREVAYWIGASMCRDDRIPPGRKWLVHTNRAFRLDAQQASVVSGELGRCGASAPQPPAPLYAVEKYSTELLYFGRSSRHVARPVTPLAPISHDELAERRVPFGEEAAARQAAGRMIDKIEAGRGAARPCGLDARPEAHLAGRFLFVTRRSARAATLASFSTMLETYLDRLRNDLGLNPPADYMTIYLAACAEDAALIARTLHNAAIDPSQIGGYSVRDDLSLVALWSGGGAGGDTPTVRTLRHELFHLVAEEYFGDMPQWLNEGLAQYYGVVATNPEFGSSTILPTTWGELPSLRAVLEAGWFRFDAAAEAGRNTQCTPIAKAMMHADVARMFLAYVAQTPGRLRTLFEALRRRTPDDWGEGNASVAIVEESLGAPVETLQQRYLVVSTIRRDDGLFRDNGDGDGDGNGDCVAAPMS